MKSKDWMKAEAVKVKEEEYQKEINYKQKEMLKRQESYCEVRLIRVNKEAKLNALGKILLDVKKKGKKVVEWLGIKYDYDMLAAEFNLERHYWKMSCNNEKYLLEALKRDGLTDEDIISVEEGEFKKEVEKKKEKIEGDYVG